MATNASVPEIDPWAMLGDPTRRSIIEHLTAAPCSVTELADMLPVSRPAVSQHLRLLKDAGVVHDEARGTRRVYSIDAARLARYRRELDAFWGSTLSQLENVAQDPTRDPTRYPTQEHR